MRPHPAVIAALELEEEAHHRVDPHRALLADEGSLGRVLVEMFRRQHDTALGRIFLCQQGALALGVGPSAGQGLARAVFLEQPAVPPLPQLLVVRRQHEGGVVRVEEGVLVGDLHDRDRGIVHEAQTRMRIAIGQELPGIFLLQLDHPLVEDRGALDGILPARLQLVGVPHAVGRLKEAIVQQVQVDVDTPLLEFGDEEAEAVEHLVAQVPRVALLVVDEIARPAAVDGMDSQHVHAVFGEPGRPHRGLLLRRDRGRTGDVGAEEPCSRTVLEIEVPIVAHGEKPMLTRRRIEKAREVDAVQVDVVQRKRERVPVGRVVALQGLVARRRGEGR